MGLNNKQKQKLRTVIDSCKNSCAYFIENYCKVKHPAVGEIPFKLFKYQRSSLEQFVQHRFNLFSKTRQCGISTLCGAYVLWNIMFFKNKTVLVVSKSERESKEFLNKNIKFTYKHLPTWMRKIWKPLQNNEHSLGFANGSKVTSLPAGPEVLRQYSSSLNIIDEAAFMQHMDAMWAAGYPTLTHGGACIVISTSNGVGNWYWQTYMDAKAGLNDFNVIEIDWWEMDWEIEVPRPGGQKIIISPTHNIRETTPEEKEKYGPYWSPWLEEQFRQLTQEGGQKKFAQEVLRDFVGSGDTVIPKESIEYMEETVSDDYKKLGKLTYVHPITEQPYEIDFENNLWIWKLPQEGHIYSIGVDVSSGESTDYSAICVIDVGEQEQVAEYQGKCTPRELAVMVDYVGRWYNTAFVVPERSGIGVGVCQDLYKILHYPSLYRNTTKGARGKSKGVGYNTTGVSKSLIDKALIDNLGREGITVYSRRLLKHAQMYIHLGQKRTGTQTASMNDDCVIAAGLSFIGAQQAIAESSQHLVPFNPGVSVVKRRNISHSNDPHILIPTTQQHEPSMSETIESELNKFTKTLASTKQMFTKPITHKSTPLNKVVDLFQRH